MTTLYEHPISREQLGAFFPDMCWRERGQPTVRLSTIPTAFGKKTVKGVMVDVVNIEESDGMRAISFTLYGHGVARIPLKTAMPASRRQFSTEVESALKGWLEQGNLQGHPYRDAVEAYLSADNGEAQTLTAQGGL